LLAQFSEPLQNGGSHFDRDDDHLDCKMSTSNASASINAMSGPASLTTIATLEGDLGFGRPSAKFVKAFLRDYLPFERRI
jgi:hypothetical protein